MYPYSAAWPGIIHMRRQVEQALFCIQNAFCATK